MKLGERAKELGLKGVRATGEDDLAFDAEAFAAVAKELFATHPLRVVRLWKATGKPLADALETPELARVEELHLTRNRLSDADVEALIHAPHVGGTKLLELGFCGLSGRTGALFASADPRRFGALRELSLFANKLGQAGTRALAGARLLAQLTDLDLEANHGGDDAVAELLASAGLRNMERLVIARNEAGAKSKAALEASKHAVRLTKLTGLRGAEVDAIVARNLNARTSYEPPASPTEPLAAAPARRKPAATDPSDRRGAELVAQLAEDPSDPDLRAVYADWLQEQGDPRGQLVTADPTQVKKLQARVEKDFQTRFKNKSAMLDFDGGLIVSVGGQLRWILEHGAAIFEREPVRRLYVQSPSVDGMKKLPEIAGIERVRLIAVTPPTAKLVKAIPWKALPKLGLELRVRGRELADYLPLPEMKHLRVLRLYLPTPDAIEALLTSRLDLEQLIVDEATRPRLAARFGKVLVSEPE